MPVFDSSNAASVGDVLCFCQINSKMPIALDHCDGKLVKARS